MSDLILHSDRAPALRQAVQMWADGSTDPASDAYAHLVADKVRILTGDGVGARGGAIPQGFFVFCAKSPQEVTPADVRAWRAHLESYELTPASVYAFVSRLSSFYEWLRREPVLGRTIVTNPAQLARPDSPKAYQSDSTQALTVSQVKRLLAVVRQRRDLIGLRDYALLRFYLGTGKRRSEIIRLTWGDLDLDGEHLLITTKDKGGEFHEREVRDPGIVTALLNYLEASGRLGRMRDASPIWLRHDPAAGERELPLSAQGFIKNLKRYADEAGIDHIHLHQTRHTFARWVSEEADDLTEVQTALGHKNLATTRVYADRVAVIRDKWSEQIAARLGDLDEE